MDLQDFNGLAPEVDQTQAAIEAHITEINRHATGLQLKIKHLSERVIGGLSFEDYQARCAQVGERLLQMAEYADHQALRSDSLYQDGHLDYRKALFTLELGEGLYNPRIIGDASRIEYPRPEDGIGYDSKASLTGAKTLRYTLEGSAKTLPWGSDIQREHYEMNCFATIQDLLDLEAVVSVGEQYLHDKAYEEAFSEALQ